MAKPATVDKWKTKKWYEIVAPAIFKEKPLAETFASDYRLLVGRTLEKALSDLTGDSKLQKIKLCFKITDVKGERALTNFLGHVVAQDFEHSLVRRRTSKIYANQTVETKDAQKIVVKSFIITMEKINLSRKNQLRNKLIEIINREARSEKFEDFINSIIYGKISGKLKKELHKIYPVRHVIIQKTEIL